MQIYNFEEKNGKYYALLIKDSFNLNELTEKDTSLTSVIDELSDKEKAGLPIIPGKELYKPGFLYCQINKTLYYTAVGHTTDKIIKELRSYSIGKRKPENGFFYQYRIKGSDMFSNFSLIINWIGKPFKSETQLGDIVLFPNMDLKDKLS